MMKRQLHKDIRKRLNRVHHFAKQTALHHEEESIHAFRVSYKKLRALYRMLHADKQKAGLPANIKELYTAAGSIRDLQLHYNRISDYCRRHHTMPITYLNHILSAIAEACTRYDKIYKHCSFSRLAHIVGNHIPHKLQKRIRHWEKNNLTAISQFMSAEPNDTQLHEVRKHVKDQFYTQSYLHLPKDYSTIADSIGNYIDHSVQIHLLETHIHHAPATEQTILRHALQHWQSEMTAAKKQAMQAVAAGI